MFVSLCVLCFLAFVFLCLYVSLHVLHIVFLCHCARVCLCLSVCGCLRLSGVKNACKFLGVEHSSALRVNALRFPQWTVVLRVVVSETISVRTREDGELSENGQFW